MTRKKSGHRTETFAEVISAELGRKVISTDEAARVLNVGRELVHGLAMRGQIESVKRETLEGKPLWFVYEDAVLALAQR